MADEIQVASDVPASTADPAVAAPVVADKPADADARPDVPALNIPGKKTFEQIKADRRSAELAKAATSKPVETPKTEDKPADAPKVDDKTGTVKAKVDIEPETLQTFSKLASENRIYAETLKAAEPHIEAGKTLSKAKELAKSGKHLDAFKMLGLDIDAANMELLGAAPANAVDPRIDELKAELEALKARDGERTVAEIEQARAAGRDATVEYVKANSSKFALLAKSERWIDSALKRAQAEHDNIVAKEKRRLSNEEKDSLVLKALEEEEKDRAEDAKLYGAPATDDLGKGSTNQTSQGSTGQTITSAHRGPVSTPGSKKTEKLTFEQVRQRRREAMRGQN